MVKLRFNMVDLNAITYAHGGRPVAYRGNNRLACGVFRYNGHCAPAPRTHEFRVDALDKSGKTLATAKARKSFKK